MPYYASTQRGKHPTLVKQLAKELKQPPRTAVAKPPKAKSAVPFIMEEEQQLSKRLHVYVIWDKWKGVEDGERGGVILDAYEQALGPRKALQISLVMGLTPQEATALGIV
jgi:hypothetical protein